ncbi:MAG: preprotein translocase subunit Sec61beta [Candidatus Diapherotrites archaeon CG11_big_fil_rev_8_21_14_0_20_37_9]|nr:MAG: preprotein translocase subunit Sec61beta [Candidatus Diapherotrites archaeon CG11_big_fil_rev_8_21_14_0_20_37_9]
MKFTRTSGQQSGPSSAIGIMRFFDADSGGPKISPEFVIGVTVVFTILIAAVELTGFLG